MKTRQSSAKKPAKRRNRNTLEPTAHELRYAGVSQTAQSYLKGSKARPEDTAAKKLERSLRAKKASAAYWANRKTTKK